MKLSIVTVCKNDADNLERTIISIINQSFKDYELIIIDGASNDNTFDVINKYKSYVSKFVSEPDSGIFNAQNKGVRYSEGDYICFLNAGDYFTNSEILKNVFENEPAAEIIYGDINYKFNNGLIYRKKSFKKLTGLKFLIESLPHPSCFFKRTLFEKVGQMDENFRMTADYEFFMRAILKYKCQTQYIPIPVAVFNLEGLSSKHEHSQQAKTERKKIQEKYIVLKTLRMFRLFRLPIIFFLKKIRYLFYLFLSRSKKDYTQIK
jgi:glycosyltransferase involved in cell wall biosynthesis